MLELPDRDLLLLFITLNGIGDARQLALERLPLVEQIEPVLVELGAAVRVERPELLAVGVQLEHGEPRLRRPQRQLLSSPRNPRGEDPILELVVLLRELGRRESRLTGLAQPVKSLALVFDRRLVLARAQDLELLTREQVFVARDDRRLFRGFLLANPHRAALL